MSQYFQLAEIYENPKFETRDCNHQCQCT